MSQPSDQSEHSYYTTTQNCDRIPPDGIVIARKDLEMLHRQLVAQLQELRRLLGYPPLLTSREIRRQAK